MRRADPAKAAIVTILAAASATTLLPPRAVTAQEPVEGEVRQLVTFRFLPGRASEAHALFRDRAVPLYRENADMLSFRGFSEVESPVPLDLVVVSAFRGMEGLDASNEALTGLAADAGDDIRSIYGAIAALSATHHDQFIEILPDLATGDPADAPLVAFVSYRMLAGERERFLRAVRDEIVPWERERGVPSQTARFLVSDGWHYLRMVGFDSLGAYQRYWTEIVPAGHDYIDGITTRRREIILAPVPEMSVR